MHLGIMIIEKEKHGYCYADKLLFGNILRCKTKVSFSLSLKKLLTREGFFLELAFIR